MNKLGDKTKVMHGQTPYTTFLPHPSHLLYRSLRLCHRSVIVCRLGLSSIICRHQEQIINETPAPYFGVFSFQIVLQTFVAWDSPPPTIYGGEDCSLFLWHPRLKWMSQLFLFGILYQLFACSTKTPAYLIHAKYIAWTRDKIMALFIMVELLNHVSSG